MNRPLTVGLVIVVYKIGPRRSPDLTPYISMYGGYMTNAVCDHKVSRRQELHNRIACCNTHE